MEELERTDLPEPADASLGDDGADAGAAPASRESVENLLASTGRKIDEVGGFDIEIKPDRTREDIFENRPGAQLRNKILNLPESPGVYMYLDRRSKVIYVGKAKRLKRRVSSYFNRRHDSTRTNLLVRNIVDLRFIVVPTEEDALHLENAMIKHYQPHYNVLLKDDKSYPWIVVTRELYPRIFMTREKGIDGKYYGPYSNVQSAKLVLDLIRDTYPLRSCRHALDEKSIARGRYRLCLDYHIGKCGGACRALISPERYGEYIKRVRQILNGETVELERALRDEMTKLGEDWKFEEAQAVKEKYEILRKYNAKSIVGETSAPDADVFAYVEGDGRAYVNFMHTHHGAVTQSLNLEYVLRRNESSREEILSMAIAEVTQRFEREFTEVIVPFMPDVEFAGTRFTVPQRGERRRALDVAVKNATQYMKDREKEAALLNPDRATDKLMERMKSDFRLNAEPRHIECFDNSNLQGSHPVASCVVFRDGKPSRKEYRHFNVKTVEGPDDYASMREIVYRRYSRLVAEGAELPDLIIADGGKGQMGAIHEVLEHLQLDIPIAGLAKDSRHRTAELLCGYPPLLVGLRPTSPLFHLLSHIQEEVHRFAISFHRQKRSKDFIHSELEQIPGVGEKTVRELLQHFRTVAKVKAASFEELAALVGEARARKIRSFFHPEV